MKKLLCDPASNSIEERSNDSENGSFRYAAIWLWIELLRCASILGDSVLKKYTLENLSHPFKKVVKKDPNLIKSMQKLWSDSEIYVWQDFIKLDPGDIQRPTKQVERNRELLSAGNTVPAFVRFELKPPYVLAARSNIKIPDVKSIAYVFDGTSKELQVAIDELLHEVDHIAFGYENSRFHSMITTVSKIDRTTIMDRAAVIKDLFGSQAAGLPDIDMLIRPSQPGAKQLTLAEKLNILEHAGPYRNMGFICRTQGLKTVRFNIEAYLAGLKENGLLSGDNEVETSKALAAATRRLKINVTFNKLLHVILHEAYVQGKLDGHRVYLDKKKLMTIFGSRTTVKYRELCDALDVMRYFEYIKYRETESKDVKKLESGYFLTRMTDQRHAYIVDVNPGAVGCVVNLGKKNITKDKLKRGYYRWAPILVYASSAFSQAGYLLAQLLILERGNQAIKVRGFKVISFCLDTIYKRLQIGYKQPSKCYRAFIMALKEVTKYRILYGVEPSLKELVKTRPKKLRGVSIKFFVRANIEDTLADICYILPQS